MNTDHQINRRFSDIGRRSVHGSLMLLGSNALQLVLMVGTTMVLARVLTPGDFGLVAMGTLLIGMLDPIRQFGLPPAIVHQRRLEHEHLVELFRLSLKLSALLALVMSAMAPLIAWFFDKPNLTWMILLLTAGFLVRGTATVPLGLLRRQMRFGVISTVRVSSLVAGAATGIAWALWTQSYWALVLQHLMISLTEPVLLWLACGWRPTRLGSDWESRQSLVRAVVAYCKNSTLSSMVNSVGMQMDRVLLGRFVGVEQLGLYQNAQRWAAVPSLRLLEPIKTVAVSGFSRLRHDPERYRAYARKAFTVVIALTLPTLVFLCIEAREFVLLLLGAQWIDAVPLFQILVIGMLFTTTDRIAKWIYLSEGETGRALRWQLFATACLIASMVIGLPWGAVGVAAGFCAAKALLSYPTLWYCLQTSPLRSSDFWGAAWRPAIATSGAAAALWFLRSAQAPSTELLPFRLAVDAGAFTAAFIAVWLLSPGGLRTTRELLAMLKSAKTDDTSR